MTTELSFLLDLLLNHKMPPKTKELVASRIKEVESKYASIQMAPRPTSLGGVVQSPSTQAILNRNPDLAVPLEAVAQTPAAQAALTARAEMMANVGKGTAPKKYLNVNK